MYVGAVQLLFLSLYQSHLLSFGSITPRDNPFVGYGPSFKQLVETSPLLWEQSFHSLFDNTNSRHPFQSPRLARHGVHPVLESPPEFPWWQIQLHSHRIEPLKFLWSDHYNSVRSTWTRQTIPFSTRHQWLEEVDFQVQLLHNVPPQSRPNPNWSVRRLSEPVGGPGTVEHHIQWKRHILNRPESVASRKHRYTSWSLLLR
jgi:hypothetical protein